MGESDELTAAMQLHAMKANQIGSYKGKTMTAVGTELPEILPCTAMYGR